MAVDELQSGQSSCSHYGKWPQTLERTWRRLYQHRPSPITHNGVVNLLSYVLVSRPTLSDHDHIPLQLHSKHKTNTSEPTYEPRTLSIIRHSTGTRFLILYV